MYDRIERGNGNNNNNNNNNNTPNIIIDALMPSNSIIGPL